MLKIVRKKLYSIAGMYVLLALVTPSIWAKCESYAPKVTITFETINLSGKECEEAEAYLKFYVTAKNKYGNMIRQQTDWGMREAFNNVSTIKGCDRTQALMRPVSLELNDVCLQDNVDMAVELWEKDGDFRLHAAGITKIPGRIFTRESPIATYRIPESRTTYFVYTYSGPLHVASDVNRCRELNQIDPSYCEMNFIIGANFQINELYSVYSDNMQLIPTK